MLHNDAASIHEKATKKKKKKPLNDIPKKIKKYLSKLIKIF